MTEQNGTFFFLAHTHWEGAVFKTRAAYLDMGLPNILRALKMLKQYPEYRFVLDQACYIEPFLQRYPEEEAAFRQFVDEGRLAIVGGTDVMLDVNMPGGESFIRQVLYGKGFFRRKLGVDVTVGWGLDTFGHHAQMPQLLAKSGFSSYWFQRGVTREDTPSEFYWEGLDGSRIPAFWLAQTYANVYGSPQTLPEFLEFIIDRYDALAPFTSDAIRIGLAGADVCEPEEHVPALMEQFNRQQDRPFRMHFAAPADYEEAVAQRQELPVVTGDLNPIFQGTYSSRIELKQRTRELERLLTSAEQYGAILRILGGNVDDALLWRAWEPMLFNQAHDLMSGVMTDHVYEDSIRGFDFSQRIAEDELNARLQSVVTHIDTRGEGIPLVVSNTLSWTRTDVATATVGFTEIGVRGMQVIGPDGQPIPVQILGAHRYEDGSLVNATITFVAKDIPALGYAVYHVLPQTEAPAPVVEAQGAVLENEYYRLQLDPATGAITALTVKDGDWQVLGGLANVVAMEEDHGDFWELYQPLNACMLVAGTARHTPPQPGSAIFSIDQSGELGTLTCGLVVSEFTVSHPFSAKGNFQTTIRLIAGNRRIEIRTKILNNDTSVRYRALFPTILEQGRVAREIPFGAIEQPEGIEMPAQNWIDYSDDRHGIAVLNRGLPGNNVADGTMLLSLLRSTQIVAYGYGGGYEPGMGSESGLELGKELTLDYALVPHAGDWRQAEITREGLEFNHPLIAYPAAPHAGKLPARWGLLVISHPNVIVSSLKNGENGGVVLRVYETTGTLAEDVTITFSAHTSNATEVNLLEDPISDLNVENGKIRLTLHPFEIRTIKLILQSQGN